MRASAQGAFDGAVVVRLFERLRSGVKVSEVLRDLVRTVAEQHSPRAQAFFVLRDELVPLLMVGWPGPAIQDFDQLFAAPESTAHELAPSHGVVKHIGVEHSLPHGQRYLFRLASGLEGSLVVLGSEPASLEVIEVMGSAAAALVHTWDADRRLKELAERHRLVAQATQHVIYDWDMPTDTLTWNSRMSDVFGHPPNPEHEEISWWRAQIHPDDRPRATASLERAMRESELFWTCEYRFRRSDSTYAWVFDRGTLVYDADARAIRMLGVMEDISRDRELESRLALASRLAAVGSLASGISHEINNPLAWVTSNLSFALEELKKLAADPRNAERCDEIAEALDDSQTGANRIAQIVSDLRTFAHADSEKLAPVSIRRVVEGALTMANNELRHRARVVKKLDDAPMVLANEARLGQALLNLLLNAAWSAGTPGVAAEVVVSSGKDLAGNSVIEVRDNGAPLDAEVLPHLFDPFYNVRTGGEGIGLGLAVTHSIITGFGGAIDVESSPSRGTTFRVVLPAVSEDRAPRRLVEPIATPAPPARRAVVYVIDDEPAILSAINRTLSPMHEVVAFTEGRHALESLKSREPDLILCDLMMPDIPGAEIWARIEADFPHLLSRIVLLTGGAFTREAQAFLDKCPARVVDKPFTPRMLRETIGELVSRAN